MPPPGKSAKLKIPPLVVPLDALLAILKNPGTFIDGSFHEGSIETDFEISPSDFLKYAEDDLLSTSPHKYVNALSNAKRALDCQLDTLLIGFGFYAIAKKGFWGFPKKVELLNSLGLLAPRVLSKINRTRNLMEHEFKKPDPEKVEDFIDIVGLFLAATVKYTLLLLDNKSIGIPSSAHAMLGSEIEYVNLDADLNYAESQLIFSFSRSIFPNTNPKAKRPLMLIKTQKFVIKIAATDPVYKEALREYLRIDFQR